MFRNRLPLLGLAGALLLAILLLALNSGSIQAADAAWRAQYWNNTSLSGTPVLERDESDLNHDWGQGYPPGVNADNFSARWRRTVHFSNTGTYRFTATADDGMRIWVDDVLILDAWSPHNRATFEVDRHLTAGDHRIRVHYYEATGNAVARLQWRFITEVPAVIHNWRGEYYANNTLAGSPMVVRDDAQIAFNWERNSPFPELIPADFFSVRWTRSIYFNPGRYTFSVTVDDGVRLWVNNQLLVDRWFNQTQTTYTADITLPAGPIPIKMEYYDAGHHAVAQLSWTPGTAGTINNWRGEYYNNDGLAGGPVAVRDDAGIDFNWGNGAPIAGLGADYFSARWTRTLTLPPGRYRFTTTTDDGVRLWVNNQLLIDRWIVQPSTAHSGEIELLGGPVPLKMEYFERTGEARATLTWQMVGTTPTGTGGVGTATVTAGALNVRRGPGTEYNILTYATRGTVLNLLGYRNSASNWVMVGLANGTQGWVHTSYIQTGVSITGLPVWNGQSGPAPSPAPPPAPGTMVATVTAYHLNMRSGPGTSYSILTVLDRGAEVTLSYRNQAGNWVYGTLSNGTQGWIHAGYIRTPQAVTVLPLWNG